MYAPFELNVERLICVQQERPLFKPLNFTLSNQQVLLLHGPNGVGKTTCLRTLAGLLPALHGKLSWDQLPLTAFANEYLSDIAYLGHHTGIKLALSPKENLQIYLALINKEQNLNNLTQVLKQVNLTAQINTPCMQLSAGQQRRVALARLFLAEVPLWILDEPLTALDAQAIKLFQQLLAGHLALGGAAILTSHQYFNDATSTLEMEPWHPC